MDQQYKIFTWPVQQQYLLELAQGGFEIYIPEGQSESFRNLFAAQKNVIETNVAAIKDLQLDCILFQDEHSYQTAQYEVLSPQQRELPKIYLEHHPPKQHPTNAKHWVEDVDVQLVHVNHYNALMWNNNGLPVSVIENGVPESDASFTGIKSCGVVVLEENPAEDRVTGMDIFRQVKEALPLEVIQIGKKGITYQNLAEKISPYRFLFCPDRYASPGFAVQQAMMIGMPVVGLATTDLPTIISNEFSGFVHSDLQYLIKKMQQLITDPQLAAQLGANARSFAIKMFSSTRFLADWKQLIQKTVTNSLLTKI
ncbi:MAG: glycosyltransferase [Mucilaginibacter sp.]|uniref:glycosyltransferase n=1 Tax=Mucilaginibacter sp. TaxID=1882438 RepID=UPI0034E52F69